MSKHLVIPDVQVKPGVPTDHLEAAGNYIVAKKPDVITMIGDWADMYSLNLYDKGKKSIEGTRYKADIDASIMGMKRLFRPINDFNAQAKKNKEKQYKPRLILTLGNHEERIDRLVEADSKLEGVISIEDLRYKEFGWEVVPYLQPIIVDGVAYCHFFTSGVLGKPVTSASALITKKHMSCVMGHVQGRQIAYATKADGKEITGLFVGGFYMHDEPYLKWQGNKHWRGLWVLHEVNDGSFDEMPVSMGYLLKKYL